MAIVVSLISVPVVVIIAATVVVILATVTSVAPKFEKSEAGHSSTRYERGRGGETAVEVKELAGGSWKFVWLRQSCVREAFISESRSGNSTDARCKIHYQENASLGVVVGIRKC